MEAAFSAAEIRPDLKFVFMSGHSEHAELPALGGTGRPRLLRKPFKTEELADAIRAALDER